MDDDWLIQNRTMWDAKVAAHLQSPVYDIPKFVKGGLSIKPHEEADLNEIEGKELVHLQCHIGLDTLSWARLGAHVTGLDFSSDSIAAARRLTADTGLKAKFVVANVYDAVAALGATYDIVYTGVGALCWLPDLSRWAAVIANLLKPGGRFYLFEFHPLEWMLDARSGGGVELRFDYFTPPSGYREGGAVSYADGAVAETPCPTVQWNHSLGEVITALARVGLKIEELRELDRTVLERWSGMERTEDGMFRMGPDMPNMPLMYVIRAVR